MAGVSLANLPEAVFSNTDSQSPLANFKVDYPSSWNPAPVHHFPPLSKCSKVIWASLISEHSLASRTLIPSPYLAPRFCQLDRISDVDTKTPQLFSSESCRTSGKEPTVIPSDRRTRQEKRMTFDSVIAANACQQMQLVGHRYRQTDRRRRRRPAHSDSNFFPPGTWLSYFPKNTNLIRVHDCQSVS